MTTGTTGVGFSGRLLETHAGPAYVADFGGDGPLRVLLHGLEGSHANWVAVGPALARDGRVVAVDLIGFGRTPPAGRRSDLRSNRDLVAAVVEELGGAPATLVGNSMGGLLAMLLGAGRPDLIDRLVLVAPGQPMPKGVAADWRLSATFLALCLPGLGEAAMWARDRFLDPEEEAVGTLDRMTTPQGGVDPAVRDAYLEVARDRAQMPWTGGAFLEASRSMVRELRRRQGFVEFVRQLPQRALVVQGDADQLVNPRASTILAGLRADWDIELLEGVGHVPSIEAPQQLVDVVSRWLAGSAAPTMPTGR